MKNKLTLILSSIAAIAILAGCSKNEQAGAGTSEQGTKQEKIDPVALDKLDKAVGAYRKILTSIKQGGLTADEVRTKGNEADFALRDAVSYFTAKKINTESLGIKDINQLCDKWQEEIALLGRKPFYNKYNKWGYIQINTNGSTTVNIFGRVKSIPMYFKYDRDGKEFTIYDFIFFLKRYPSLQNDPSIITYDKTKGLPSKAVKLIANYTPEDSRGGRAKFLADFKREVGSNWMPYSDEYNEHYFGAYFNQKLIFDTILSGLKQQVEALNMKIKEQM